MVRKWIFIPLLALGITGIIVGSFLDFNINSALYDRNNGFGVFMASFGQLPAYGFLGTLAYGFLYLTIKHYKKIWQRILFILLAVILVGAGIYFQGWDIFCVNGYNNKSLAFLGYIISTILIGLGALFGYFILRNTEVEKEVILKVLLAILFVMLLALGITQLVKIFMSRPRFRFISDYNLLDEFKNWWESGKELKKNSVGVLEDVTSEEFKSFPSGHISNTASFIAIACYLPYLNKKIKVKQEYLMAFALVWVLVLAYTRMRVGAHFLSDVSFGFTISILGFMVVDLIMFKKNQPPLSSETL